MSDFAQFVASLTPGDENDDAILMALNAYREALADPVVLAALQEQKQREAEKSALERAAWEAGRSELEDASRLDPGNAEAYARAVMDGWQASHPFDHPEPPWQEFWERQEIADVLQWAKGYERAKAERYFLVNGLYNRLVDRYRAGAEGKPFDAPS